jgi:hypothetical protein
MGCMIEGRFLMGLSTLADSHFLAFYSRVPVSHITFTYLPTYLLSSTSPTTACYPRSLGRRSTLLELLGQ